MTGHPPTRPTIGITGGSGFIGSELAKYLSNSFKVKILDVRPPLQGLSGNIIYEVCDIRNYDSIIKCVSDADLVIHTAIIQIPLINEQKMLAYEVNVVGTQNVCEAIEKSPKTKGMILASSWHTIGEHGLAGTIDEEFGYKPDKVEDRARLYALSKIGQEVIVRFYDEASEKIYGIVRTGTVLGNGMPRETAANIFIEKGLRGEVLTPYRHSMYRPMLYVEIEDVCKAYGLFATKILDNKLRKTSNSVSHIVNICYPEPVTILELAGIVSDAIARCTSGKMRPRVEIVEKGLPQLFQEGDKGRIRIDLSKARELLEIEHVSSVRESIEKIVSARLNMR